MKTFISEFSDFKLQKQSYFYEMRDELVQLYEIVKKQKKLIDNVEAGSYTQGMHSYYVP